MKSSSHLALVLTLFNPKKKYCFDLKSTNKFIHDCILGELIYTNVELLSLQTSTIFAGEAGTVKKV